METPEPKVEIPEPKEPITEASDPIEKQSEPVQELEEPHPYQEEFTTQLAWDLPANVDSPRESTPANTPEKSEEELELERWERELGISLSAENSSIGIFNIEEIVPGTHADTQNGKDRPKVDPELEQIENELDFSIDLDLMEDADLD